MKRFTMAIISTLFIAASPTVIASETSTNLVTKNSTKLTYLKKTSPANLVNLAYRGYFRERGIPSALALVTAYSLNSISAEDLVRAGVETGRVLPNALKDAKYINGVKSILNNIQTR